MGRLFEEILINIFPQGSNGIALYSLLHGSRKDAQENGIMELIERRAKGETKPAVIYGFESAERLRRYEGSTIMNAPGVFYLRLPCTVTEAQTLLEKAVHSYIAREKSIDTVNFHRYAITATRELKHKCDNIWMSMKANANIARKAIEKCPDIRPAALKEFKESRLSTLVQEYNSLRPLVKHLRIDDEDMVTKIINETLIIVRQIHQGGIQPHEAVSLCLKSAENIQAVSEILSAANGRE